MNMDHLQSDQGTEFKGVEKTLCETLKVPIIKTSAHSPQTQETGHLTGCGGADPHN